MHVSPESSVQVLLKVNVKTYKGRAKNQIETHTPSPRCKEWSSVKL